MKTTSNSPSLLVSGTALVSASSTPSAQTQTQVHHAIAQTFMESWDRAWTDHDAHAHAALHTDDAVTVNRFGTLIEGRESLQKALTFLLGESGPFGNSQFPPLKLLSLRLATDDVMILQLKWQNPALDPDGKNDFVKVNDMIVTVVLVKQGNGWKSTQTDLHNVEKMNLPYSSPIQKN